MALYIVALFLAVWPLLAAAPPERVEKALQPGVIVRGEKPVVWTLADRMAHHKTPAVSVAFVNGGKLAWAKAYGGGTTTETLFQAASISKPVAAMVALKLVEQGKLSLDEDVNLRLKRWKVPENEFISKEKVTLRRLLSHTAGLTVHGFRGYAEGEGVPSLVDLLDGKKPANSAAVRVNVIPGTLWRYAGGGYQVMQLLVEDVTGKSFADVAQELVLNPLGMKRSTYRQPLPAAMHKAAARGFRPDGEMVKGLWHTYPEQAAAGLWTTPSDLAKVILEIQRPERVLKPSTVEEMLREVKQGYGLGFGVAGSAFSHGGANDGYRCMLFAYRDKGQGAVVMTNSDRGDALTQEILRAVSTEYGWPDYKQREKVAVTLPREALEAFAGRYSPDGTAVATVTVEGQGLVVEFRGMRNELRPESATKFFSPTGEMPDVEFEDGRLRVGRGFSAKRLK
ncbi:MAG: serine hydrolase [Bryobacteraceae bacterium]|nr:serine hydrolase [Bryobacteraceae bacterium]